MNEMPKEVNVFRYMIGHEVTISYRDKRGHCTDRTIVPRLITSEYGLPAIRAFCNLRKEERTFIIDRINRCWSADWNEGNYLNHRKQLVENQRIDIANRLSSAKKHFVIAILVIIVAIFSCFFSGQYLTDHSVSVSKYTRSDGMRISSHRRRPPGSRPHDSPYESIIAISLVALTLASIVTWYNYSLIKQLNQQKH